MLDIEADSVLNTGILFLYKSLIKPYLLLFVVILGSPKMADLPVDSIELEANIHPNEDDRSTLSSNKG